MGKNMTPECTGGGEGKDGSHQKCSNVGQQKEEMINKEKKKNS